jgi:hypothetical protein
MTQSASRRNSRRGSPWRHQARRSGTRQSGEPQHAAAWPEQRWGCCRVARIASHSRHPHGSRVVLWYRARPACIPCRRAAPDTCRARVARASRRFSRRRCGQPGVVVRERFGTAIGAAPPLDTPSEAGPGPNPSASTTVVLNYCAHNRDEALVLVQTTADFLCINRHHSCTLRTASGGCGVIPPAGVFDFNGT